MIVLSWTFSCQCPAPTVSHSLPRTSPVLLGLWTCYGHCGASSDSDLACLPCVLDPKVHSYPQSLQPQLWEHSLSIHIFHRCRVYQGDCRDLIRCSSGCKGILPSLFFGRTAAGVQLCFWPCICVWATFRRLFPTQARGSEAVAD